MVGYSYLFPMCVRASVITNLSVFFLLEKGVRVIHSTYRKYQFYHHIVLVRGIRACVLYAGIYGKYCEKFPKFKSSLTSM